MTAIIFFAGTDGDGIFRSTNGNDWEQVNTGLMNFYVFAFAEIGTYLFAGTDDGVSRSANNGSNWTTVNNGLTNQFVQALVVIDAYLFVGTAGGGCFRSVNNGDFWEPVNSGFATSIVIEFTVNDAYLFAGTWDYVYRSSNFGNDWISVSNGLTDQYIQALAVNDNYLYAGNNDGVSRSTDNGDNWEKVGLSSITVDAFSVIDENIFAGTETIGVFLSTNNGGIWSGVNTGLTNYSVGALAVSGTYLFAGTSGDGVWRRPLSEMITSVWETAWNDLPIEYKLGQNYPNPFNPSTKIKYSVPTSSNVVIKVFDILGNEIETLINEEKLVGNYEVEFSAKGGSASGGNAYNLPSGVYFYRLQADNFIETKKMMVMK